MKVDKMNENFNGMGTMEPEGGLHLLKKGQKGLRYALFSRVGIMLLLLLLQVMVLLGIFKWFNNFLPHMLGGAVLFNVCMVLYLINSTIDPTAKITWLIVIMMFPVFGALLFWYTQSEIGHRAVKKRLEDILAVTNGKLKQDEKTFSDLEKESPEEAALVRYFQRSGCFPVYADTQVTYFPLGEDKFAEMLAQLRQAEHYIFMEYFIVDEGLMWGRILEILAQKVKEGVDVKVMYDGTCEFSTLPYNYPEKLQKLGIQCKMFSPMSPFLSTHYNYRDHRKILVIDGHTAFTGGVNLADEYINRIERFGHWKDTAIMLKGEAAKSFALMFLQMWGVTERLPEFERYLGMAPGEPGDLAAGNKQDMSAGSDSGPEVENEQDNESAASGSDPAAENEQDRSADSNGDPAAVLEESPAVSKRQNGYVIPFGDCPLDENKVGERVYMDILNRAVRYVHIMTPYLILDGEMETALKFAAEKGVDVRLILPGIPDKGAPYALAKTHYKSLRASGVKIYEYTPGFVHAKVFVSDDCRAVVGTINLDYRSLYHHFECAAYMYRTDCIADIEADFQKTMEKCQLVTDETIRKEKKSRKVVGAVMKVFSPLL